MRQSISPSHAEPLRAVRAEGLVSFCAAFWRIEADLDLLKRSVGGVHYWPVLRLEALNKLLASVRLHAPVSESRTHYASKILRHALDAAADAPSLAFERFGAVDGVYLPNRLYGTRDYFNFPIHGLGLERDPDIERLLILYRTSESNRSFPHTRHVARRLTSLMDAGTIIGSATARQFLAPMTDEHRALNAQFQAELRMDFPFSAEQMAFAAAAFSARRRLIRGLLKRVRAPRLFVEVGYCMGEWIAAAHDAGMEVVELQHGLITPYHLGYSYPGRPFVPYAADRLLLFGPYWANAAQLPVNTRTTVIGCSYLDDYKAAGIAKTPRLAVVISQGVIGPALFDAVAAVASRAPGWHFRFRAHPGEAAAVYARKLAELAERPSNLTVSPSSEDFSALLWRAEIQIGVFSTGLFEGMASGTRTILLPLPGIEYMDGVLARGEAVLARDASDILRLLDTAPACGDPAKYYSVPVPSIMSALRAD